jgi:hypothetical protein
MTDRCFEFLLSHVYGRSGEEAKALRILEEITAISSDGMRNYPLPPSGSFFDEKVLASFLS